MKSKVRKSGQLLRRQVVLGLVGIGLGLVRNSAGYQDYEYRAGSEEKNCSQAAIEDFPGDFFNQDQRVKGGFLVHAAIAVYFIFALAIVCDDFFVPVLEDICDTLNISSDVAGATFMAAGTSSPEFFTNVIGTFVTESDLGIGTIIGTAVFNIFGVIATCGLFTGHKVPLEWYPITRDCFVYCLTIVVLIVVLIDSQVFWYESAAMLAASMAYTVLMYFNVAVEDWAQGVYGKWFGTTSPDSAGPTLVSFKPTQDKCSDLESSSSSSSVEIVTISKTLTETIGQIKLPLSNQPLEVQDHPDTDSDETTPPWKRPQGQGLIRQLYWAAYLPVNLILYVTVPKIKSLYLVCFVMCMAWIGVFTYVVAWMITLIGYTVRIPDSVMGLTFLAIGTSVPEVFSSLIVSRQGKGSMAVSNSIGSNTFDILVCLGLPWLIKSIMNGSADGDWYVAVNSDGLAYTVISLLASLVILYAILIQGKFVITKWTGLVCLIVYSVFLTVSILMELNVFFPVNLPMCESDWI